MVEAIVACTKNRESICIRFSSDFTPYFFFNLRQGGRSEVSILANTAEPTSVPPRGVEVLPSPSSVPTLLLHHTQQPRGAPPPLLLHCCAQPAPLRASCGLSTATGKCAREPHRGGPCAGGRGDRHQGHPEAWEHSCHLPWLHSPPLNCITSSTFLPRGDPRASPSTPQDQNAWPFWRRTRRREEDVPSSATALCQEETDTGLTGRVRLNVQI